VALEVGVGSVAAPRVVKLQVSRNPGNGPKTVHGAIEEEEEKI
jgi:hypothetical protein